MSEPQPTSLVPHNPRFRRLRSKVWNDFSKERLSDGNFVAICHHCGKQLTASSRSGTTHLKNHLNVCLSGGARPGRGRKRKLVVRRVVLNQNNSNSNPTQTGSIHLGFDQERSRFDLAMMVIKHGYRFSIVDDLGFRDFVSRLQPGFQIPDFDSVRADCMKIHHSNHSNLRSNLVNLDSRVSLSMDSWRSAVLKAGTEYLSLTCHYVDKEWKLKKKILNFVPLEPDFTGTEITSVILEKLHEWGIEKKVLSVILDNCYFSDEVGPQIMTSLSVGAEFEVFHVRSCAYILNFVIQDGLELVKDLTDRVKSSIRFVRSSQNRYLRFQEAVKISCIGLEKKPSFLSHEMNNYSNNGINKSGINNWASVYQMLESVCKYQKAFVRLYEWDPDYRAYVAPDDWPVILSLFECLDDLHHTIEKFPNVENPTSNLHFNEICAIHLSLKKWRANRFEKVALMAGKMLEKFEEFWEGNNKTIMAFASILDPRYKTKSIEYFFKNIYKEDPLEAETRIENIQNSFVELYNKYASESKEPVFYKGSNTNRTGTGTEYSNAKTFSQITLFDARRGLDEYLQETSTGQTAKSDLDLYLEEPVLRNNNTGTGTGTGEEGELGLGFQVLGWWKAFEEKYPVLGRMARDILAVPVSAVPLDDVARVLNDYLSVLDCETVQGLICAQDWLRDDDQFDKKMEGVTAVHGFADMDGGSNNMNLANITN